MALKEIKATIQPPMPLGLDGFTLGQMAVFSKTREGTVAVFGLLAHFAGAVQPYVETGQVEFAVAISRGNDVWQMGTIPKGLVSRAKTLATGLIHAVRLTADTNTFVCCGTYEPSGGFQPTPITTACGQLSMQEALGRFPDVPLITNL